MDILEDTDIIDEITDMLNDDEVGPNWKTLGKELKIPEEKFTIFEPSAKYSPTKMLLQSIAQCEPDITVDELILALVAMKRHDVIDMLHKHFKSKYVWIHSRFHIEWGKNGKFVVMLYKLYHILLW
jgi:hypothetical protein